MTKVSQKISDIDQVDAVSVDASSDIELLQDSDDDSVNAATPWYSQDEMSISGTTPDPQSDDNMLDVSHEMGLRLDETEEQKKPLNMAADVAAAERMRRTAPLDNEDEVGE